RGVQNQVVVLGHDSSSVSGYPEGLSVLTQVLPGRRPRVLGGPAMTASFPIDRSMRFLVAVPTIRWGVSARILDLRSPRSGGFRPGMHALGDSRRVEVAAMTQAAPLNQRHWR